LLFVIFVIFVTLHKESAISRTSNRQKRQPLTRNKDFFMETVNLHSCKSPISQVTKTSCYTLTKNRNLNCKIPLKIYHRNIRGLRCKTNELISHLQQISPLILCLTEHHAHWEELQQIFLYEYKLAAYFCRMLYAKGGVCMYVHQSLEVESVEIGNL